MKLKEDYNKVIDELVHSYNGEIGIKKMDIVISAETKLKGVELKADRFILAVLISRIYADNIAELRKDRAKIMLLGASPPCNQEKRGEFLKGLCWCLMSYIRYDASFILDEIERRI